MTSSGTYTYSPPASNLLLAAYARIGVRRTSITPEQIADGIIESNLVLVDFANRQPLLWKSELISQVLTQGVATYTLPSNVVMILLAYIETGSGTSTIDRVLGVLSTVEYAALTNKTQQAQPTSFWLDRQKTPTITLWQVPDGGGPYTLYMRCVTQVQDAVMPSGVTMDLPYRFLDAFTAGLAYRLARIHAPQLEQQRKMDAMEAWNIASGSDVENVPMIISVGNSSYFR